MNSETFIALIYILVMASYAGFELIAKVPPTLHTPLMSGSNALSGITIVGFILCCNELGYTTESKVFGMIAVAMAMINVVGGYQQPHLRYAYFKCGQNPNGHCLKTEYGFRLCGYRKRVIRFS